MWGCPSRDAASAFAVVPAVTIGTFGMREFDLLDLSVMSLRSDQNR